MSQEREAQFQAWRAGALERMPYFARILFALRVLDAPGLGTWAVDGGYRMYVDFDAVTARGFNWNVESVLHEVGHLFSEHKRSAADLGVAAADAMIWNAAADLSLNDDLDAAGCVTFRQDQMLPEFIGEPNGQTPHHYYAALKRRMDEAHEAHEVAQGQRETAHDVAPGNGDAAGGSDQTEPGTETPDGLESGAAEAGGDGSRGDQDDNPYRGCGSGSGGHPWGGELGLDDDLGGLAPAVGEVEHEAIRIATAAAIKDYAAKGRGRVPGGFVDIADQILTPSKTPWQKIIGSKIRRAIASRPGPYDVDPSRRSRRKHALRVDTRRGSRRVIVPGRSDPVPRIEVIRDTSGSMSAHDLAIVTREIESIARKVGVRGRNLVVTDVDAAVGPSREFKNRSSIREVAGRGGTDMRVGIEAACARKPAPGAIVVITDGLTPWPQERPTVPVVAAIVPGPGDVGLWAHGDLPEFIRVVVVDPAE